MSTTSKRKAQDLVRQGRIQEAIETLRAGLSEGEPDPYDHVYLGDLLMRVGETEDCLSAYTKAIRSYEEVGLFRNAVAIGKKMLRIDRNRPEIHRNLASLYDREGLHGEAIPHYLSYLDSFAGEAVPPNEFLETLDQAAAITGSRTEVALRLADHFIRVRRGDRAAALLEEVAASADEGGSADMAAELRRRAREARGEAPEPPIVESLPEATELGEIEISAEVPPAMELPPLPPPPPPPRLDLDPGAMEEAFGRPGPSSSEPGFVVEHFGAEATGPGAEPATEEGEGDELVAAADPSEFDFGSIDLGSPEEAGGDAGSGPGDEGNEEDDGPLDLGFGEVDLEADRVYDIDLGEPEEPIVLTKVEDPDRSGDEAAGEETATEPAASGRSLDAANAAFLSGRWAEARRQYEHLLEDEPENRKILAKLVETVRYLQDHHAEVHYLVLLGEAWIVEDELEEALECFLRVVRLDPENSTAKRRLSRFREMGVRGAEDIDESDSNSVHGVLETGRSEVEVRSRDGSEFRSEDWVELEGLLEEFKDGLKNQMDESDHQAHYDLAVSHHGMGLLEEALEEVDRALASPEIPVATERQARELKGACLMELQRYREAVHEYREALEKAGTDRQARRTSLYHLGRSLEALEEWQEAVDTFVRLKLEAPGFLDVEERIRVCESQADSAA